MTDIKDNLKKFWHFLWKEDSLLSWIVNIVLAFILIKFLIYPGLGLIFGTSLPVVAVISESMEHDGSFDEWWESYAICGEETILYENTVRCTQSQWYNNKSISKEQFKKFTMHNGFNKGDIIVLRGADFEKLEVGEIIVYTSGLSYPIIHRVIEKNDVLQTKGDHNPKQIVDAKLNEKYITKEQILGKAWIRIPWLGYIKIRFVDLIECITFQNCKLD